MRRMDTDASAARWKLLLAQSNPARWNARFVRQETGHRPCVAGRDLHEHSRGHQRPSSMTGTGKRTFALGAVRSLPREPRGYRPQFQPSRLCYLGGFIPLVFVFQTPQGLQSLTDS